MYQMPSEHSGFCFTMGREKISKEEFIRRAREVHGDKYDYSKVEYKGSKVRVCIICPIHGEFWMTHTNHIANKQGCRKCGIESKRTIKYGKYIVDVFGVRNQKSYNVWTGIIDRCERKIDRYRAYSDCFMCEEWYVYSNFKRWFEDPANGYREGYHIDKDLLSKNGEKYYSPKTCCFVPPEINLLISVRMKPSRDLPIGVYKAGEKYMAMLAADGFSKTYNSIEEAHNAYVESKLNRIYRLAQQYREENKITKRVYDALMSYDKDKLDYFK